MRNQFGEHLTTAVHPNERQKKSVNLSLQPLNGQHHFLSITQMISQNIGYKLAKFSAP